MLDFIEKELPVLAKNRFTMEKGQLTNFEKIIQLLGPETAFKRGFALVYKQGKQVNEVSQLEIEDEVQVQLKSGKFLANVKKKEQ